MARKKNASFVGSPLSHTGRDSSIFSAWADDVAGDFALVFDKVTGANGHSSSDTVNHTGSGRGCPLSLPLANQHIGRSLVLAGAGNAESYYVLVVPIFVPNGTQAYRLEVEQGGNFLGEEIYAEIRDTSWTQLTTPQPGALESINDGATGFHRWYLSLGAGWQYLVVSRVLYPGDNVDNLVCWRLYPDTPGTGEGNGLDTPTNSAAGSPFATLATMTPATVEAIDAAQVGDARPLDSWVLTRLNRQINTLWEYLTGGKVPGNNATQCTTTRDLNQGTWTAEPSVDFPIASIALGCVAEAAPKNFLGALGTAAPTVGPINWTRYPQTQPLTTPRPISRIRAYCPPFNTTTSLLKAEAIFFKYQSADANLSNWQARILTGAGTSSAWATLTQIGTSNFWRATMTAVPFVAGGVEVFQLEMQSTVLASPIDKEVLVLGWALAFDAP